MHTVRYGQKNAKFAVVTSVASRSAGRYYGFAHLLNGDVETSEEIFVQMRDFRPIATGNAGPRFAYGQKAPSNHTPPKPGDRIVFLVIPSKGDGRRPTACPWGNAPDWQFALQQMETSA